MSFNTRDEFKKATASEKLALAWVEGVERLHIWTLDSGTVYKRVTKHFVVGVADGTTEFTEVSDLGSVVPGTFYYDPVTSTLYIENAGSTNPQTDSEMIIKYRFFFATRTLSASYDLTDTGKHVQYSGRIASNPGYKHKIAVEQDLTSITSGGNLKLINEDGGLDEIFDTIIFENKDVVVSSWNPDLPFSEARAIFRGIVTDKRFNGDTVEFVLRDQLFALEQQVPQSLYTEADNVNADIQGRFKRWVYGRVDGLRVQSVDQIGAGYTITGTASVTAQHSILTGSGTSFLSEVSPDDKLIVGDQTFDIESVQSDTQLTINDIPEFSFTAQPMSLVPSIPTTVKNRVFQVADHACATLTKTVVSVIQLNRIELNNTDGIEIGDFLEFAGGTRVQVQTVAPGNIVVLTKTLVSPPAISSSVVRQPVQELYIESDDVNSDKFSITTSSSGTTVTIDSDAEFNLARTRQLSLELSFTNGSRRVTYAGDKLLSDIVSSRDFIRPTSVLFSTFYEILSVGEGYPIAGTMTGTTGSLTVTGVGTAFLTDLSPGDDFSIGGESFTVDTITNDTTLILDDFPPFDFTSVIARKDDTNTIELREAFADPTHSGAVEGKLPNYVGDNTAVSAQVLGRTEDNTPGGTWITTASRAVRDLIIQAGIPIINEASFTQGAIDNQELISIALPLTPSSRGIRTKAAVDALTKSTTSAVTLDNDLLLKYKVLNVEIPDDPVIIEDEDVISWTLRTTNAKNIRNTIVNYRHRDIDPTTLTANSDTVNFSNEFVQKYVGTNKTKEVDVYLYNKTSADIMSHRIAYYNSLGRSDIEVTTDLRLEDIEIGDVVVVNFRRLYKRFGDSTSRKKALTVVGKQVDGKRTKLSLSDLGNIFSRSSVITPNTANDYASASEDEKLKYGYITANNGITNDEEETDNIHLIS